MHYFNITDAGYAFLTPPPRPGAYVINGRPHTLWAAPKWTGMLGEDDENVAHPASPLACANEFCKSHICRCNPSWQIFEITKNMKHFYMQKISERN